MYQCTRNVMELRWFQKIIGSASCVLRSAPRVGTCDAPCALGEVGRWNHRRWCKVCLTQPIHLSMPSQSKNVADYSTMTTFPINCTTIFRWCSIWNPKMSSKLIVIASGCIWRVRIGSQSATLMWRTKRITSRASRTLTRKDLIWLATSANKNAQGLASNVRVVSA